VPRGVLDQALITGLTTLLSYTLTAGTQDMLDAIGSRFAPGCREARRLSNGG